MTRKPVYIFEYNEDLSNEENEALLFKWLEENPITALNQWQNLRNSIIVLFQPLIDLFERFLK